MSTTTTITVEAPRFEYFFRDGHLNNAREVLTGDKAKKTFDEIPVIDVSGIFSDNLEDRMRVAREVGHACENVGFMYIKNHGIDIIDSIFETSRGYFELPMEKKMETFILKNPTLTGYDSFYQENREGSVRGENKEGFLWGYDPEIDPANPNLTSEQQAMQVKNQWPSGYPGFREMLIDYQLRLLVLARKLMRTFALALGAEETYFDSMITAPFATLKLLHYPPQDPDPKLETGTVPHTDFETFTILNQDMIGGLEVLNKNGVYIRAKPVAGTFVVNVGDFLQRVSNDRFVSTVHRVRNFSGQERYSIPFFFSFNLDAEVGVMPCCTSEENPAKYPTRNLREFTATRKKQQIARFQANLERQKKRREEQELAAGP